jgi:DNA-binding CsgD family transcriptional regulator
MDLAKQEIGQTWNFARHPPNPSLTIKSLPLGIAEATTCMPKEMQTGKISLLLTEENSLLSNPNDHFGNLYRLTRQEIKVLQGLVAGYSTKEIADRHYVSYHTVRSQLASLLQKTGCHRQEDLLRLFFQDKARLITEVKNRKFGEDAGT